ncbi:nucleoside monophosphate kinase [Blattabacterium cuenoti]|uniref:nucleoside monophosphate kinase n=1 Tax=Blattabacterium cuenoti TaxID=1653831 RepID=UPI00163CFD30|nr:nucleoside monophosphate kinase [Blattabacterium cuenoti]
MIHIILFGPPGCGKGTQAKFIKNQFGFVHLSTGIMFRKHIEKKTSIGKKVSYYINRGKLVPDLITTNIFIEEMKKCFHYKGIIYDGYPRTEKQILSLEKTLKYFSLGKINIIFHFKIQKEVIIYRLLNRGKTSFRKDDININTVEKRIEEYNKKTSLIWKNQKWKNHLVEIKANYSIKEISIFVEKKILNFVKNK